MNSEEIQSLIEQLKAQGLSEDEIMNVFYETFVQGKMDRKDLETLAEAMGYELTDDFKNEETPDPIEAKAAEGAEGMTKEELEDAKAIEPGESEEEFKEKLDEAGEGLKEEGETEETKSEEKPEDEGEDKEEETESKPEDEGDMSEDEEWEKAQKMFKIND